MTADEIGRLTPNGIRQGVGAKLGQIQMVMAQGALKKTERELDTAFTTQGQYYRVLVQKDGEASEIQYTRDGAFYLSPISETEKMLVTRDGNPVLDENDHPIIINGQTNEYTITEDGNFIARMENSEGVPIPLGVTMMNKPQFLERKGNNLLGLPININELNVGNEVFTDLNGALRGEISIVQGSLEEIKRRFIKRNDRSNDSAKVLPISIAFSQHGRPNDGSHKWHEIKGKKQWL